jgi:hypothetical protein
MRHDILGALAPGDCTVYAVGHDGGVYWWGAISRSSVEPTHYRADYWFTVGNHDRVLQLCKEAADAFEHYALLEADVGNRSDRYFMAHVAEAFRPQVDRLLHNPAFQHAVDSADMPRRVWADLEAEVARLS